MEKLMSLTMKVTALALVALTASCNFDGTGSEGPLPAPNAKPRVTRPVNEPLVETSGPVHSADKLAAAGALSSRLSNTVQRFDGTRVAFVDCAAPACNARLVAPSRTALRELLQAVSQDQGGQLTFVARERLDAYSGRTFEADVVLGSAQVREVPQDEEELLTNNDD